MRDEEDTWYIRDGHDRGETDIKTSRGILRLSDRMQTAGDYKTPIQLLSITIHEIYQLDCTDTR